MADTVASDRSDGPTIVAPHVRDLDAMSASLGAWLDERLQAKGSLRLENLQYPLGAGLSHETILFDAVWIEAGEARRRGLVVRIKPTRDFVYLDDMFDQQYRIMQLLHERGEVRVAQPLWIEHDVHVLGAPFFVMVKCAGRVAVSYPPYARQGWLVEATPAQRQHMWRDAVSQLATIQHVPIDQAAFLNLNGTFAEPFDQEVDRWRRYLEWVDPTGDLRLLRDGLDALLAARPGNRPEGIVWGDARLGNMMIGEDFGVVAVMDWEQPSIGGALHDLGWWLRTDYNQTIAQGIATPEGMGSRAETIALWEDVSGKSAVDIDWYDHFAVFKMECLAVRLSGFRKMPALAPGENLQRCMAA